MLILKILMNRNHRVKLLKSDCLFDFIIVCMSSRVCTIKLEMLFQWLMSRMEKHTTLRSVGLFRTNTVKRVLR